MTARRVAACLLIFLLQGAKVASFYLLWAYVNIPAFGLILFFELLTQATFLQEEENCITVARGLAILGFFYILLFIPHWSFR
jgi:hypothetical protein